MWNDRHLKTSFINPCNCQADPINTDGSFFHNQMQNLWRCLNRYPDGIFFPKHGTYHASPINMAAYYVSPEPAVCSHCTFQVYLASGFAAAKTASSDRLCHHIGSKSVRLNRRNCQTHTIHSDTVTDPCPFQDFPGFHCQDP